MKDTFVAKRNLSAVLALVALTGLAAAPRAAQADGFDDTGLYLALYGLFAIEIGDVVVGADESFGAGGRAGWRFHPRVAGEVQFEWVRHFEGVPDGGGPFAKNRALTTTANARLYLLEGRFQPILLAGLGAMSVLRNSEATNQEFWDTGFAARVGLGLEAWLTHWLATFATVSTVFGTGAASDVDYVSFEWGLQARF